MDLIKGFRITVGSHDASVKIQKGGYIGIPQSKSEKRLWGEDLPEQPKPKKEALSPSEVNDFHNYIKENARGGKTNEGLLDYHWREHKGKNYSPLSKENKQSLVSEFDKKGTMTPDINK